MGFRKTLQELSILLGVRLQGDPLCQITGIASIENAKPGDLTFLSDPQYRRFLSKTQASAVILGSIDSPNCKTNALISDNPKLTFGKFAKLFEKSFALKSGIHPTAIIGKDCQISKTAWIGPYCVVGDNARLGDNVVLEAGCIIGENCKIGNDTVLKPRVTLYNQVEIGQQCLIHSGAVLGSDGFGFANDSGNWVKMPHIGRVVIKDFVEIGSNTTIDRGFLEDTTIGSRVIIDNLVQIGHNVTIGDRTAIAGCVGIAGSTKIGANCLIGGGSSIAGHIEILDNVYITATSAVNRSLTTPGVYSSGIPAKPNKVWLKNVARFQTLDEMAKRIRKLENLVLPKTDAHLTGLTEQAEHANLTEDE